MAEISNTLLRVNEALARIEAAERTTRHGGDGGGEAMEARLAKVEAAIEHIQTSLTDIKTDAREIKNHAREDFRVVCGLIIAVALAMAGLMAKGFHWL